jgi:hypothetical protein
MQIIGIKIDKKESGDIMNLLESEFKGTQITYELYNNSYYIYLKNSKNTKQLEKHEMIYLKNSLKRVKSDFLYNLYPFGGIQNYFI